MLSVTSMKMTMYASSQPRAATQSTAVCTKRKETRFLMTLIATMASLTCFGPALHHIGDGIRDVAASKACNYKADDRYNLHQPDFNRGEEAGRSK